MTLLTQNFQLKIVLTPAELFNISEEIKRKFSPMVSVRSMRGAKPVTLTSTELLEISTDISRKFAPVINSLTPKVIVLPVDPHHLYLSWHLGRSETALAMPDTLASKPDAQDIVLRIYPKPDENVTPPPPEPWFDVDIEPSENRRYVRVPKEHKANVYTVVLGERNEEGRLTTVFATSNVAQTPRANDALLTSETGVLSSSVSSLFNSSDQEPIPVISRNASGQGVN